MSATTVGRDFDVVIAGGGPVGATAAALLARATRTDRVPLRVGVIEPRRPAIPPLDAPMDLRVSAYSRGSERVLRAAGAWDAIEAHRFCPYERMRVWHESVPATGKGALARRPASPRTSKTTIRSRWSPTSQRIGHTMERHMSALRRRVRWPSFPCTMEAGALYGAQSPRKAHVCLH